MSEKKKKSFEERRASAINAARIHAAQKKNSNRLKNKRK